MEPEAQGHRKLLSSVLAASALAALLLVLAAGTGAGPGVGPDGVVYIDAAGHIAAGEGPLATDAHGDARLVTTWPPLFPALLGFGTLLGLEPGTAALLLNTWCHAALALLAGVLAWRVSGRREAALVAAPLIATTPIALRYAGCVLTEPLFLALTTGALLPLLAHHREGRLCHLVWAGSLLGLACMQRYAGYAWLAAVPLWLMLRPGRLRNVSVFLAAALPLPLVWRIVIWTSQNTLDPRGASFGLPTFLHVKSLAHSLSTWLLPESSAVVLRAAAAGLVVLAVVAGGVCVLRRRREPEMAPGLLLVLVGLCYLALLGTTVLFLDRALLPEPRMLLPVLPLALAGLGWALSGLGGSKRWAAFVLAALIGLGGLIRDVGVVSSLRVGEGYAAPEWRDSPTLQAALEQPGPLYASNPQPLILRGVPARALPLEGTIEYLMPLGVSPWPDTAQARRELREKLAEGGCVVWFNRDGPVDELKAELDLVTLAAYEDGELLVGRQAQARK
ncbi:MAG: glycosyltransferase family 39 protein [Planctomycetes bacterium]|nr:glycosyltransferase family 39 protein [Planctomycetota bacterium]